MVTPLKIQMLPSWHPVLAQMWKIIMCVVSTPTHKLNLSLLSACACVHVSVLHSNPAVLTEAAKQSEQLFL